MGMDAFLIIIFVLCMVIIGILVFPEFRKKTDDEMAKQIMYYYNQLSPEGKREADAYMKKLEDEDKKKAK